MYANHFEKTLITQYKKGFKTYCTLKKNIGTLSNNQYVYLMIIFDKIVNEKNIKRFSNLPFFYTYNLFKKHINKECIK